MNFSGKNNPSFNHGYALRGNRDKNYDKYCNIKQRCYNKNNPAYKNYGGRGIKMFEKWINDLVSFIEYIKSLDNSDKKGS